MAEIGHTYTLKAVRRADTGMYLAADRDEILLPRRYVPDTLKIGDEIEVFLFRDSEDRPTAITEKPLAEVGGLAVMTIKETTTFGAFADWGLPKDLLIPLGEMENPLKAGDRVLVKVLLDFKTDRIIGSTKIARTLSRETRDLKVGQQIEVQVWGKHPRGLTVIAGGKYKGLLYENELKDTPLLGEKRQAWIKKIREDGKLDVSLKPIGFVDANQAAREAVLQALKKNGGSLPLHDKSPPEDIEEALGLSKKAFKAALGTLFRERRIKLLETSISLSDSEKTTD